MLSDGTHCYHTTETSETCPDTLPPLTPADAQRILQSLERAGLSLVDVTAGSVPVGDPANPRVRRRVVPLATTGEPTTFETTGTPTEPTTTSAPQRRRRVFPVSPSFAPFPQVEASTTTPPPVATRRQRCFPAGAAAFVSQAAPVRHVPTVVPRDFPPPIRQLVRQPAPSFAPLPSPVFTFVSPQSAADSIASASVSQRDMAQLSAVIASMLSRLEIPADFSQADAAGFWIRANGPDFLAAAVANPDCAGRTHNECFALMLLISHMPLPANQDEALAFLVEQGLIEFVEANTDSLANRLINSVGDLDSTQVPGHLYGQINTRGLGLLNGFASNWSSRFPQIMSARQGLSRLGLRHAIYRYMCFESEIFGIHEKPGLSINRAAALESSTSELTRHTPSQLRRGVGSVSFIGENAGGQGLVRDWFSLIAGAVSFRQSNETGIPLLSPRGQTVFDQIVYNSGYSLVHYNALGRLLALSVIHGYPVGFNLPAVFYKKLLGREIVLEDIRDLLAPSEYAYIVDIMDPTRTADYLDGVMAPMMESGATEDISLDNRDAQFALMMTNVVTNHSPEKFQAIIDGFFAVIPRESVSGSISHEELRSFIRGNPEIDIADFRAHYNVGRGYVADSPQVEWLFTVLEEYDQPMRRKFLRFVTGRSILPTGGFGHLGTLIRLDRTSRTHNGDNVVLPTTHTCFHSIDLPAYESLEELRRKLTIAIEYDAAGSMEG